MMQIAKAGAALLAIAALGGCVASVVLSDPRDVTYVKLVATKEADGHRQPVELQAIWRTTTTALVSRRLNDATAIWVVPGEYRVTYSCGLASGQREGRAVLRVETAATLVTLYCDDERMLAADVAN